MKFQSELNELWGHNVLDFVIIEEDACICFHFDVDEFKFTLMCLGFWFTVWTDLVRDPIDGVIRGVLIE